MIIPNEKAKYIKYIFSQVLKGKPQAEIRSELKSKGFDISRSGISGVLRNPLYMGKIFVPEEDVQLAYLAERVHEPLVSEKLFYKAQQILNNQIEKRRHPKTVEKRRTAA